LVDDVEARHIAGDFGEVAHAQLLDLLGADGRDVDRGVLNGGGAPQRARDDDVVDNDGFSLLRPGRACRQRHCADRRQKTPLHSTRLRHAISPSHLQKRDAAMRKKEPSSCSVDANPPPNRQTLIFDVFTSECAINETDG
jgi:hypothetical protein